MVLRGLNIKPRTWKVFQNRSIFKFFREQIIRKHFWPHQHVVTHRRLLVMHLQKWVVYRHIFQDEMLKSDTKFLKWSTKRKFSSFNRGKTTEKIWDRDKVQNVKDRSLLVIYASRKFGSIFELIFRHIGQKMTTKCLN